METVIRKASGYRKDFTVVKVITVDEREIVFVKSPKSGQYSAYDKDGKIQRYVVGSKSSFDTLRECEEFVEERVNFWRSNRK